MPGPARKEVKDGQRQCSKCRHWKKLSEFTKDRHISDGLDTKCRTCKSEHNSSFRTGRYGLSQADYQAMLLAQGGVCACCGEPETYERRGKVMPLSVDHDHETGKIRGLLCMDCNIAEGHLKTPEKILALYTYISKHRV